MKKITAIMLVVVMMFGVTATSFAAVVTPEFSAASVAAGETVTVTLNLDEALTGIVNMEYRLYFNPELFELQSSVKGNVNSAITVTQSPKTDADGTYYGISLVDSASQGLDVSAGTLYTLVFKALSDVTESSDAKFEVIRKFMKGANLSDIDDGNVQNGEITITVSPKEEISEGYTVTMPEDKEVTGYQKVQIPVTVGHTDSSVKTFNAVDMTFSYDSSKLSLDTKTIEGFTVKTGDGTVRVQGYGQDRDLGTAFTLEFMATDVGTSAISVTSAKVDISANAISADAPEASKIDNATNINVKAFDVTLPEDFDGEGTARPGESYTFTAKDVYYNYEITATMGGNPVEVAFDGETYTIANVTGNIVITSTKTAKQFIVTINGEGLTGAETATYMTDYVATLNPVSGFSYEVAVTIAGEAYTGYATTENIYTIPGADIKGDIVFTITKTQNDGVTVTITGEDVSGATSVILGTDYTFTVTEKPGYEYDIKATMGEKDAEIVDNNDGTYTIKNVDGPIVITVTKTLIGSVEVHEYIDLNGRTMFLVLVSGTPDSGYTYAYENNVMYYSNQYNAYAYLTIVEGEFGNDAAKAKVSVVAQLIRIQKALILINTA